MLVYMLKVFFIYELYMEVPYKKVVRQNNVITDLHVRLNILYTNAVQILIIRLFFLGLLYKQIPVVLKLNSGVIIIAPRNSLINQKHKQVSYLFRPSLIPPEQMFALKQNIPVPTKCPLFSDVKCLFTYRAHRGRIPSGKRCFSRSRSPEKCAFRDRVIRLKRILWSKVNGGIQFSLKRIRKQIFSCNDIHSSRGYE